MFYSCITQFSCVECTVHQAQFLRVWCDHRVRHLCIHSALTWLPTISFLTKDEMCLVTWVNEPIWANWILDLFCPVQNLVIRLQFWINTSVGQQGVCLGEPCHIVVFCGRMWPVRMVRQHWAAFLWIFSPIPYFLGFRDCMRQRLEPDALRNQLSASFLFLLIPVRRSLALWLCRPMGPESFSLSLCLVSLLVLEDVVICFSCLLLPGDRK